MESMYTSILRFKGTILIPWVTSCMRPAHPMRFNVARSLGSLPVEAFSAQGVALPPRSRPSGRALVCLAYE